MPVSELYCVACCRRPMADTQSAVARQRWTLDTPEDFTYLDALFGRLPPAPAMPGWREILAIAEDDAELKELDRPRAEKPVTA